MSSEGHYGPDSFGGSDYPPELPEPIAAASRCYGSACPRNGDCPEHGRNRPGQTITEPDRTNDDSEACKVCQTPPGADHSKACAVLGDPQEFDLQAAAHVTGLNPKDLVGSTKVDMSSLPGGALAEITLALLDGHTKYGPYNWRDQPIQARTYVAAAERHLKSWLDGQERSEDADVHHLAAVAASCIILIDAQQCGTLVDNRPKPGESARVMLELQPRVRKLLERKKP